MDPSEQPTKPLVSASDISEAATIAMPAPDKLPELFQPWYPGKVIEGLYRIEEEIAKGGMGVVHKATDLATNDSVVIKSILPQVAQIDEYKQRFIREAEEWVALGTYPHIVRAFTAHEIEYLPRIVLEYVEGASLQDMLEKGMPPLDRALDIAIQICWGMAYAHDKKLTHRDLKPGNIMVSTDGAVKVTDFGLVKRMFEKGEELLSEGKELPPLQTLMTQGILGTPEYMAPEQWQGKAGQTLDIYAFGIILYEIFCGSRPFEFSNLQGMERITAYQTAHCQEPPPEPELIRKDLPVPIGSLVLQCLAKDPKQRPKTFRHVARKIDSLAKQLIGESFRKEPTAEELDRHGKLDQANGYLRLGKGCSFRGDYDKAIELYEEGHKIFQELADQKGIGTFLNSIGIIFWRQGEYDRAMAMYQKSLAIGKAMSDQLRICESYINMGLIYQYQGDYDNAMEMYQKNLKIFETISRRDMMNLCYSNMGIIFQERGQYDRALEMYQKSLEISEPLGHQSEVSLAYMNMGNVFQYQGNYDQAMKVYQKSLKISEALSYRSVMSMCYTNMGSVFNETAEYDQAIAMQKKCLEIAEELGDKRVMGYGYLGLGSAYRKKNAFDQALKMLAKSIEIWKTIGNRAGIWLSMFELGKLYSARGQIDKALEALNDSLEIMKELKNPKQAEVEKLIAELKEQSNTE
ncbi:tetratricopeptide repeat protein [Planctomycetota bacterium]